MDNQYHDYLTFWSEKSPLGEHSIPGQIDRRQYENDLASRQQEHLKNVRSNPIEVSTIEQAKKIHKSNLPEKTKEFIIFVLAQLASLDETNKNKLEANTQKGIVEKLKEWHQNETIYYEMPIKDGKRNGLFMMWLPNGRLLCEMPFEVGKLNGIAVLHKATGDEKVVFEDDCPIFLDK